MAFNLSAKDATAVRKEFLEDPLTGDPARPVSLESLVALRPGHAIARLGGGAFALPLHALAPLDEPPAWRGEKIREVSWSRYGAAPATVQNETGSAQKQRTAETGDDFLE